jgi:hypothetical protein
MSSAVSGAPSAVPLLDAPIGHGRRHNRLWWTSRTLLPMDISIVSSAYPVVNTAMSTGRDAI